MKFKNPFKKRLRSYYIYKPYGRYDSETIREWEHRYEVINDMCIENPKVSLSEIGNRVGLSMGRISQLIHQYNQRFPDAPIIRESSRGKANQYTRRDKEIEDVE